MTRTTPTYEAANGGTVAVKDAKPTTVDERTEPEPASIALPRDSSAPAPITSAKQERWFPAPHRTTSAVLGLPEIVDSSAPLSNLLGLKILLSEEA